LKVASNSLGASAGIGSERLLRSFAAIATRASSCAAVSFAISSWVIMVCLRERAPPRWRAASAG